MQFQRLHSHYFASRRRGEGETSHCRPTTKPPPPSGTRARPGSLPSCEDWLPPSLTDSPGCHPWASRSRNSAQLEGAQVPCSASQPPQPLPTLPALDLNTHNPPASAGYGKKKKHIELDTEPVLWPTSPACRMSARGDVGARRGRRGCRFSEALSRGGRGGLGVSGEGRSGSRSGAAVKLQA